MQQRSSAVTALCLVVAVVVAGCTGAAAAPRPGAAQVAGEPVADAAGRAGGSSAGRDDDRPPSAPDAWQPAPAWAMHPELLPGSQRFRELARDRAPEPGEPTNVVLITADDMTAADLRWMPKTRALVGAAGTQFADSLSPHPLCCPARATILTGQFAQNNGVRSNRGDYGGLDALDQSETLPVWLHRSGYQTAFLGKYLNGYGTDSGVPPGWDHWAATSQSIYDYYHFTLNVDGRKKRVDGGYQTEYYADRTERLIPQLAADDRPFFLWQSHVAPHTACPKSVSTTEETCWLPPTPAVGEEGSLSDVPFVTGDKPSYDEADASDKPSRIARLARLDPQRDRFFEDLFRGRLESLQAVDDTVARTVSALAEVGELDNTLIVFTSDNGFLNGEHRYAGKIVLYEPSLRVPLLMRGPSVPAGVRRPATTTTVDLAPTILAAAGARPGLPQDGRNLLPVARGAAPGWETVLIQGGPRKPGQHGWLYRGVRTSRYTYIESRQTGERELYDRVRDPYQLRNSAGDPAYARVQQELRRRLLALQDCSGAECRRTFGPAPRPAPRPGAPGR